MAETAEERAERLAAALRRNLRLRKRQAKVRHDLSGLDPNRTDTPLNRHDAAEDGRPEETGGEG